MSNNIGADDMQIESKPDKDYALRGKIMLSAITVLFGVVIFLAILHLYVKWYLFRLRRRELQRRQRQRQRRRTHIDFYVDNNQPSPTTDHGLEADVLNSLPLFAYSPKTHPEVLECAVCLSEFEENETGRFLPKCSHFFHVECIDMWFRSHSTCPLCRSTVEPVTEPEKNLAETVISVDEPGSSSGNNTASLAERTKRLDLVGVRIEIPRRTEFDRQLPLSSPGFRSPGSRLMSFKRLLSMNKKSPMGTPGGTGTSSGAVGATELDLESGRNELTQESTEYIPQGKQVCATLEKRSDVS